MLTRHPCKPERAARRLATIIREHGWQRVASRNMLRLDRAVLGSAPELNPALAMLEDGDCMRPFEPPANPKVEGRNGCSP